MVFFNALNSFPFRRKTIISSILLAVLLSFMILTRTEVNRITRHLSIDFGDGDCEWSHAVELSSDQRESLLGTLYASYPGSGMKLVLQQSEGLTGIKVGDENDLNQVKSGGIVKTQYPHHEGKWSYGDSMDQVVMLVRNPRWAIPSYFHNEYSSSSLKMKDEDSDSGHGKPHVANRPDNGAYEEILNTFISAVVKRDKRERMAQRKQWREWRDSHIEKEINLWALQIDFYMEDGAKYWMDGDSERKGEKEIFRNEQNIDFYMEDGAKYWMDADFERKGKKEPFLTGENDNDKEQPPSLSDHDQQWPQDKHCINDITRSCYPAAIITQERLNNPATGPAELAKLANVLRKGTNQTENGMINPSAISCIYHETWISSLESKESEKYEYIDEDEDLANHKFTIPQLQYMLYKLREMRNKYSSGPRWVNESLAMDLVSTFDLYLDEILSELNGIKKANPNKQPLRTQ
eukprot:CAMPEP_0194159010 /NCGR_PEP_ID=MMETSP0152-20130528/77591_1 /TAXON_ID=1049557 /ORGANISM="Thalassiothrix antarctica, Strain L6-D1" /LENGTH=462 /DNA_ID=CAMNT_0038868527 /DNA_START=62 /DNA_END=1450 /DNA_ORIENTATION=+